MHVLSVINLFLNGRFSGSPEKGLDLTNFSYREKKKRKEKSYWGFLRVMLEIEDVFML